MAPVTGVTRPFTRPKKVPGYRKVVSAGATEGSLATHCATRERDISNLEQVQRTRALAPPSRTRRA